MSARQPIKDLEPLLHAGIFFTMESPSIVVVVFPLRPTLVSCLFERSFDSSVVCSLPFSWDSLDQLLPAVVSFCLSILSILLLFARYRYSSPGK